MNDIKINKKRIHFSHDFKRDALILYTSGLSAYDALLKLGVSVEYLKKDNGKYASKLINKWKKEIYSQKENLYLSSCKLEKKRVLDEIEAIEKGMKNTFFKKDIFEKFEKCKSLYISKSLKSDKFDIK